MGLESWVWIPNSGQGARSRSGLASHPSAGSGPCSVPVFLSSHGLDWVWVTIWFLGPRSKYRVLVPFPVPNCGASLGSSPSPSSGLGFFPSLGPSPNLGSGLSPGFKSEF